jgi:predicted component of type VI protein secretion system
MKKFSAILLALFLCCGTIVGCSDSQPAAIEQTMTQEEIDKIDAEYEAEMEAAENDTMGEG